MARNRKNQNAGLLLWPAVKASLICLVIVVCCVGYVWQKKQIGELSKEITRREELLNQYRQQNDKLKQQLARLLTPSALEDRVRGMKLGLGPPNPAQILRLQEPAAEPAARVGERRLAFNPADLPEL